MTTRDALHRIPTNILSGFLGVGKTTTITTLLREKPLNEHWAVLVNEFGEIGVDGTLLEGATRGQSSVSIREVPGGCLCCAASVPMQVALNQLLRAAKPDRLLIEPTGLGHPRQIIAALSKPEYETVLDLRATLTLVDARKVADPRYTEHPTFNQQLEIADLLIAHKADLYGSCEIDQLRRYLAAKGLDSRPLYAVSQGAVAPQWLDLPRFSNHPTPSRSREMERYRSHGWRYNSTHLFNRAAISALFATLDLIRLKAVILSSEGAFCYNLADGTLSETTLPAAGESRIELIIAKDSSVDDLEGKISHCILPQQAATVRH